MATRHATISGFANRDPIPRRRSHRARWSLDQKAVFEKWLQRLQQRGALLLELLTEAVFDPAQSELKVC